MSKEIQNILKPLFNELRDLNEPLDKEEFVDAGIRLYDVSFVSIIYLFFKILSLNEKNLILKFGVKKKEDKGECTFHPKLNKGYKLKNN